MSVLYVAGAMRSGTTIAGQVLASTPDAVLVGEIKPVLLEPHEHEDCDCGHPRATCPFWSAVYAGSPTDADALTAAAGRAWSLRHLPHLLAALLLRRPLDPAARVVVDHLRRIAERAGDRPVVDTSKSPVGVVLWRLAGQRVHLVQCVRDPRAVARTQAQPSAATMGVGVPRAHSWAVWVVYHLLTLVVGRVAASTTVVTYRGLRGHPAAFAGRVWRRAGLAAGTEVDAGTFRFDDSHVLSANPRRSRGAVRVLPLR